MKLRWSGKFYVDFADFKQHEEDLKSELGLQIEIVELS